MAVMIEQALAFVDVLTSGKAAVHFEAVLGRGKVPTEKDWSSNGEEAMDRCFAFIAGVEEYLEALRSHLKDRPVQQDMFPETKPKSGRGRKAAAVEA